MKHIYKSILAFLLLSFAANYGYAQCFDDGHSPFKDQGWLSCQTSLSPNSDLGNVHWMEYNLGILYAIESIDIWNHNVWAETAMGAKQISIDYSLDRQTWTNLGTFDVDQAPGSWKYTGFQLANFDKFEAQYILISVLETWGSDASCAGIAEMRFNLGTITSTEPEITATEWNVYPNPAVNELFIEMPENFEADQVIISNSVGQTIGQYGKGIGTNSSISISDLVAGVYTIRLEGEKNTLSKQFVKIEKE